MLGVFAMAGLLATGCTSTQPQDQTQQTVDAQQAEAAAQEDQSAEAEAEAQAPAEQETTLTRDDIPSPEADHAQGVDITGCDTFTQIVDKLSEGMGYTNEKIGQEDVLLVSSGTYDNGDGNMAAIDAEIFYYKDGAPAYLGFAGAGGTAYPLAVLNGNLYAGGNHFMKKFTVSDGKLMIMEEAFENYDADGNATYVYGSDDGGDYSDMSQDECKNILEGLFDEYSKAAVLNFDTAGGGSSADAGSLPAYEYPGPEVFYTVMYKFLIDTYEGNYPDAQVGIPCPIIVAMDDSNRDDILVYGDFWYFNYNLNGDLLENVAGGSYPGVMHFRSTDEGYEVTGMEVVADGSDFDSSAKEIFGKYYNDFIKAESDADAREKTRAQIIANYVAANNLSVTAYQDYGWDPVKLPEENIDSFYSQLY